MLVAWILLAGCSDLSRSEIEAVSYANLQVIDHVEQRLDLIGTKLERHGQGDGEYVYEGVLEASSGWDSGTITVNGAGVWSELGTVYEGEVAMAYDAVTIDGLIMDGALDVGMWIDVDTYETTVRYSFVGALDLDGDARGHAEMDWAVTATASDRETVFEGTIDGRDLATILN